MRNFSREQERFNVLGGRLDRRAALERDLRDRRHVRVPPLFLTGRWKTLAGESIERGGPGGADAAGTERGVSTERVEHRRQRIYSLCNVRHDYALAPAVSASSQP